MAFPWARTQPIVEIQALAVIHLEIPIYIIDAPVVIHDLPHIPD
jgi:hypothetical protein